MPSSNKPTKTRLAAFLGAALIVAAAVLAGAAPVVAAMTDAQLVATRVAAMKQDGMLLRGAKSLTGQEAIDAAATILKNFTNFPALFRPGSITADSRALPAIWENWGDFTARLAAEKANAAAMLAAAKAGNKKAYLASIEALKRPCSNCHLAYARVF